MTNVLFIIALIAILLTTILILIMMMPQKVNLKKTGLWKMRNSQNA